MRSEVEWEKYKWKLFVCFKTQTSELIPPQSSAPLYIGRVPTANKDLGLAELMLSPWHVITIFFLLRDPPNVF